MTSPRLILLPGIGADARLFESQRKAFPGLFVPEWLPREPAESLASYGRRMASTIVANGDYYLGGVSFGGMVALEMASHLSPKAVFLISSCRSGRQIPRLLRCVERCSRIAPNAFFDLCRPFSRVSLRLFGTTTQEQNDLLLDMLADTKTPFIRLASRAILDWSHDNDLPMPVFQVHGDRDRLIPHRNMTVDHLIPGAGHLAIITHSDEVNSFLREQMA